MLGLVYGAATMIGLFVLWIITLVLCILFVLFTASLAWCVTRFVGWLLRGFTDEH